MDCGCIGPCHHQQTLSTSGFDMESFNKWFQAMKSGEKVWYSSSEEGRIWLVQRELRWVGLAQSGRCTLAFVGDDTIYCMAGLGGALVTVPYSNRGGSIFSQEDISRATIFSLL